MKKLFYLLSLTILFISCEKDNLKQEINNKDLITIEESSSKNRGINPISISSCSISGPTIVTPGSTVEYTFFTSDNPTLFALDNGDSPHASFGDGYIDENGNWVYQVIFESAFTCLTINFADGNGCRYNLAVATADNLDCLPNTSPVCPRTSCLYTTTIDDCKNGYAYLDCAKDVASVIWTYYLGPHQNVYFGTSYNLSESTSIIKSLSVPNGNWNNSILRVDANITLKDGSTCRISNSKRLECINGVGDHEQ